MADNDKLYVMRINYLTTNELKFKIAQQFFNDLSDYELVRHSFSVSEIQDTSCENIARESALIAAKVLGEPCVAMDAGFFIEALNGFPGPFVKYVNEYLSEKQILNMLTDDDSRSAYFLDALAIGFPDGTSKVFSNKTVGNLAEADKYLPSDWPVNSLFIPTGYSIPLGSMSKQQQQEFWYGENRNWKELTNFLASRI